MANPKPLEGIQEQFRQRIVSSSTTDATATGKSNFIGMLLENAGDKKRQQAILLVAASLVVSGEDNQFIPEKDLLSDLSSLATAVYEVRALTTQEEAAVVRLGVLLFQTHPNIHNAFVSVHPHWSSAYEATFCTVLTLSVLSFMIVGWWTTANLSNPFFVEGYIDLLFSHLPDKAAAPLFAASFIFATALWLAGPAVATRHAFNRHLISSRNETLSDKLRLTLFPELVMPAKAGIQEKSLAALPQIKAS